ncbi:hypothetical protein CC85DRAFT_59104 [Cutaneotrichosporon oleaginosum]|uniref:Uncharacterized protein n=1 Tax=Cutaneotrichosporon oleaginosum TaxID=879819 RepID=A0A0J0XZ00_9TREE|nr:uncharacterized protein CC85DRAFT_59104 [Cutaneotrichosporon oleaginosum]KLT46277.1 hypothetical protein CC85DRAFT_59104 [Cutaneotrichosporon oleaginosum]TXT10281.1 hypothetical protein COLE_04215 [Cutaneotrichosporon oleaginosum]
MNARNFTSRQRMMLAMTWAAARRVIRACAANQKAPARDAGVMKRTIRGLMIDVGGEVGDRSNIWRRRTVEICDRATDPAGSVVPVESCPSRWRIKIRLHTRSRRTCRSARCSEACQGSAPRTRIRGRLPDDLPICAPRNGKARIPRTQDKRQD